MRAISDVVKVGGVVCVVSAGYLLFREWQRGQLVEEYISEVHELRTFYETAVADGELDQNELQIIGDLERAMAAKEKELEREGMIPTIIQRLSELGIVVGSVGALYIAGKIVTWLLRNRPPRPPTFTCPSCGQTFATENQLETHVRDAHGIAVGNAEAAWQEFIKTPDWVQDLVGAWSGLEALIRDNWKVLTVGAIVIIVLAIIAIIIFSGGSLAPELAPILGLLLL